MKIQLNTAVASTNNYPKKETAFASKASTFNLSEEKLLKQVYGWDLAAEKITANIKDGFAKLEALFKAFMEDPITDIHISGETPGRIEVKLVPSPEVLKEAEKPDRKFDFSWSFPKKERYYSADLTDSLPQADNAKITAAKIERDARDNRMGIAKPRKQ